LSNGWFIGQVEDYTINVKPEMLSTMEVTKDSSIKLQIYPNPTTGNVVIKMKEALEKYEIYSTSGQKIMEGNSVNINTDSLIPGTYLMKIQTRDKK
jgi:sporulation protein YlmC with PRC-barrel domain